MTTISSPIVAAARRVLRELAREARLVRLAGLAFAARELPEPDRCVPSSRRVTRKRPSRSITAARTGTTRWCQGARRLGRAGSAFLADGGPVERRERRGTAASSDTRGTRRSRAADRGAEIHQRLVEVEDVAMRQDGAREVPKLLLHRVAVAARRGRRTRGTARARRWCRESPRVCRTRSSSPRRRCRRRCP